MPVKTIGTNSSIKVYPNPADRIINIEYIESIDQPVNLTIYNSRGNVVITRQIKSSKTQIGINNLPAGVYYLNILNGNDVKHGIFVKQ
jgi:hypothetical protein